MKILISVLLAFAFQVSHAAGGGHGESGKAHKDWNQVFKQPVANPALATPPEKTKLLSPAFLAEVKATEVVLKWEAVEGAKYHLQVAKDPNFKWLLTNEHLMTNTEYTVKGLEANHQYFWRVYTQKPENMAAHTKGPAVSSQFETVQ